MDRLDQEIIDILQVDGRVSNAEIARRVRVSEGTVRRRLSRLTKDGTINVIAVPNLEKMGITTAGLVAMQVEPGMVDEVADALAKIDQVHLLVITTGARDLFAWVAAGSSEDLSDLLRKKIGTIRGVRSTETFVNLAVKKRTYGLVL